MEAVVKGPILDTDDTMAPQMSPLCPGAEPSIDKECADCYVKFFLPQLFLPDPITVLLIRHLPVHQALATKYKQTRPLLLYHCAHTAGILFSINIVQYIEYIC